MPTLNPWFAKAAILLANVVLVVIRAPHGRRSRAVRVVRSRKGPLEIVLLTIAWAAFFPAVDLDRRAGVRLRGLSAAAAAVCRRRMMREEFGQEYEAYLATTKRLLPGVW